MDQRRGESGHHTELSRFRSEIETMRIKSALRGAALAAGLLALMPFVGCSDGDTGNPSRGSISVPRGATSGEGAPAGAAGAPADANAGGRAVRGISE
jgi:hypothetical protein